MGKQFGPAIIEEVKRLKGEGYSHREIAELLGYTYDQIKRLVFRDNRQIRRGCSLSKKRGRPKKSEETDDVKRLERRIKELEMQVDLYKVFLDIVGKE